MIKELKMDYERNEKKFPQIFILIVYRFSNYIYYSNLNKFIKRLILLPFKIINKLFIEFIFHIEIPCDATIGGGVRIRHPYGIIIKGNIIIGENCTIFQYVTLGNNEHKSKDGSLILGKNVYIGAGAKIIGNLLIEDNVKVGANAVVVKNIEKGSTVYSKQIIKNGE